MNVQPLKAADIEWADVVFCSAMLVQKDSLRRGVENLKEEVAVLEAQLADLEQKNLRSPVLLQKHCDCNHFAALTYSALLLGVQV